MITIEAIKSIFTDKKTLLIIAMCVIAGLIAWNVYGGGDNPSGADQVRSDLRSVGDQQQSAIDGLGIIENGLGDSAEQAGTISAGLGDVAGTINTVEDRIDASQDRLKSSASLIAEGKSIIRSVQQRNGIGN